MLYKPCRCSKEKGEANGKTRGINPVGGQSIEQGERLRKLHFEQREKSSKISTSSHYFIHVLIKKKSHTGLKMESKYQWYDNQINSDLKKKKSPVRKQPFNNFQIPRLYRKRVLGSNLKILTAMEITPFITHI